MADTSNGAMNIMRGYVNPTMQLLAGLASIACVLFLVNGGFSVHHQSWQSGEL
jgi:hypothetical protein